MVNERQQTERDCFDCNVFYSEFSHRHSRYCCRRMGNNYVKKVYLFFIFINNSRQKFTLQSFAFFRKLIKNA